MDVRFFFFFAAGGVNDDDSMVQDIINVVGSALANCIDEPAGDSTHCIEWRGSVYGDRFAANGYSKQTHSFT